MWRVRAAGAVAIVCLLATASGCSDRDIEQQLATMSGTQYLELSDAEKQRFASRSLARFTTWRFWDRPDLCDYVLDEAVLLSLYEASAEKARDKLMVHTFVVRANEKCVEKGQLFK